MSTNAYYGCSLAEIDEITDAGNDPNDALAILEDRVAKANPDSHKARRTKLAIQQLQATGRVDAKACFAQAKKTPKVQTSAKPTAKRKAKAKVAKVAKAPALDPVKLAAAALAKDPTNEALAVAFLTLTRE